MIKNEIKNQIKKAILKFRSRKPFIKFEIPEIEVDYQVEKKYGDYSTNVCLKLARILKQNPVKIGENLKSQISDLKNIFEKIEIKKPGFINFFLSQEFLQKKLKEILREKERFGKINVGQGQKVNIEFISANPTGPLHLGHGRGAFFGDSLANILEKAGYKVVREYYINDAQNSVQIKELGKTALGKGTTYLTPKLKSQILKLKSKLKKIQNEGEAGYLLAQEIQREIKNFIEKKLKIKFDIWVSEQDLYRKSKIKKIFRWLKTKNLVYQKEGAWWLKTSKFGDVQDWVIVRADGIPTYLLSDIAYHKDKFDRKFNKVINIWGADHQAHVSKLKAAAKILGYRGNFDILISQIVRLKRVKISKRKGKIITLEWLINEVGLDPARFLYLTKSFDTQMEFDVELAKERSEKSPVYYCQYAHARICSILRKLKTQNLKFKITTPNLKLLNHPQELQLIKQLIRFPEIIEDTAKDYQVQRIPQYAIELATSFHQFYRDCRVILKDKKLTQARQALIFATKIILKDTLSLLGISAPEKM